MNATLQYDEAWVQRLLKIYLSIDVIKQRQIIISALEIMPDERILDIGSGPGLLIEDMATLISPGGSICGIDISESFIALSQKRCSHISQVEIRNGDAAAIPYGNDEFDIVVSTQVYEYIEDVDTCLKELYRVLKPAGRALVMCTDWDTLIWNTDERERMRRILAAFEKHCAHPRLPRKIVPKLRDTGFDLTRSDVYTMINLEYNENTYSHGIIDFIASYVSGRNGVSAEEAKFWAEELRRKGQDDDYFFSICRYIFLVSKPG